MGFKRSNSLLSRMWLVSSSVILLFGICFIIATIMITERSRNDYEVRESEILLNSLNGTVTANLESYKDLSRLVMLNENVATFLRADVVDAGMKNDAHYGIMDVLHVSSDVDSVFVFRNDGDYMSTGRGEYRVLGEVMKRDPNWGKEILSRRGGTYICMNGNNAVYRTNGQEIITIARSIYDIYTQQQTGMLMMNVSLEMLESVCRSQHRDDVVIMTDKAVYLAGNRDMMDLYDPAFKSETITHSVKGGVFARRMVSGLQIEDTPILIICTTTASTAAIPKEVTITLILILTAFLISVGIAGRFIVTSVTRPIMLLTEEISATKDSGWLEHLQSPMPDNEIGQLAASYDNMIDHLNEMFTEVLDKEESVRKAEMRVLNEQIKPHFLYNSLETISCMAVEAGAENVHSALETLGSFYRNFLSKGDREITLRREITIIKDYLALQKLRYEDTINDEYIVQEEALTCMIPKLILQPLVENSINHGIRMKGEPGTILIRAFLEEDMLHLIVRDDGVGMTQEQIEEELRPIEYGMNGEVTGDGSAGATGDGSEWHGANTNGDGSEWHGASNSSVNGFGLRGTIDRIRYYCDNEDVVRIESVVGEYTQIEILIPQMVRNTN